MMKKRIQQLHLMVASILLLASCGVNEPDSDGTNSNSNTKHLVAYMLTEYDNEVIEETESSTATYDSYGRVVSIGDDYFSNYVWSENKVRCTQYDTEFILHNGRVVSISSDEDQISLEYNASNKLVKIIKRNEYDGLVTTTLRWNGNQLTEFCAIDGNYTYTYTLDYSIKNEGIGFFNTWECEIVELINEELFVFMPELFGFEGSSSLPSKITCIAENTNSNSRETETTELDYTINNEGYITEMWSTQWDDGLFRTCHSLTWK